MKSLIKQRREKGAICPKCKSPDYTTHKNNSFNGAKPNIKCNSCGNVWQYGYDGGMYKELENKYN